MPSFSPMGKYQLTSTQVDLILHCLEYTQDLTTEEDNERRRIVEVLNTFTALPSVSPEDPYANICDI